MTMKLFYVLGAAAFLAGCGAPPDDDEATSPAPPPAAALQMGESVQLGERLRELEEVLRESLGGDLDDGKIQRLLQAEALTDRLLEAEPPLEWLATDYSLDSKLRQLQALADRIVAQIRRGGEEQAVERDVRDLRRLVALLRRELEQPGGGDAPPPLDSRRAAVRVPGGIAEEGAGGE